MFIIRAISGVYVLSTLFTISNAWHDSVWLYEQLAFASDGDAILLMQDGVLGLHSEISLASFLAKCQARDILVIALKDDCVMRGVENKYSELELVDYHGFVDLVCQYDKQVAW